MHESSLVMSILEIAKETLAANKAARVGKITLTLGELACVETHSLLSCFEIFAEGTPAEGAELIFERVAAMKKCAGCGQEFGFKDGPGSCPGCGGNLTMTSGREFYLKSMELEGGPEPPSPE